MTGRARRFVAGFSVEGIGLGTTYSDPFVFCDESYKASEANANTTDYRWVSGRVGEPSASSYSTDPFRGDINTSSLTLYLHNRDDLAERFRFTDTKPTTVVASDIDAGDGTVTLGDPSLADTVVYINDETIRLTTHTGGGTYNANRALWGSDAQDHPAGDFVYSRGAPHWPGRRVRYVVHNLETGEERIPWRGYIKDIDTADDGTKIRLMVSELVSAGIKGEANVGSAPIDHALEARRTTSGRRRVAGSLLSPNSDEIYYQSRIREATEWVSSGRYVWIQADGALVLCKDNQPIDYYPGLRLGSEVETDFDDGEASAPLEDEVREVFVVNPAADALVQDQFDAGDWASSTGGLRDLSGFYGYGLSEETFVHHPWSVGLTLINSGTGQSDDLAIWEELREAWGLGLSWAMVEGSDDATDTIRRLIRDFPYLRMDRLVLGWDGKPYNPWRVAIYKCFLPFGLIPGVTNEGLPTFRRFGLLDIEQYNDALSNELTPILPTSAHKMGHGSTADRIVSVVGELPWQKGDRIEERALGNSKRSSKIVDQREFELDYTVVAPENYDAIAGNALSQSRLAHYAMPRWRLGFDDYDIDDVDYTVGEYVSLSRWPVQGNKPIDPSTGEATLDVQGKAWATGLVIGRTPSFKDHTYELEILLTSYIVDQPARWRGPAMEITSTAQQSTTTRLYTDATSNFGFGDSDNNAFYVGDEVQTIAPCGLSDGFLNEEIVDIGSDGTGDYIEVDALVSVDGGRIARLATYDSYENTGVLSNIDRAWAFLSDASGGLGAAGDAGDVYGTLWVGPTRPEDYSGDYDGSAFVGLDNDLVQDDGPADTYTDHALRNNEFYLYENAARFPVEFSCATNSTTILEDPSERLLSGWRWLVIAMGRFPVLRGMDTITSHWHAGVCDTAFSGNGEVEIMMELVTDAGVVERTTAPLTDTTADTVEVQHHTLTLDVGDVPTSKGARLLFKVRGAKASTASKSSSATLTWPDRISSGAAYYEQRTLVTDDGGEVFAELIHDDISTSDAPAFHPASELPGEIQFHACGALALRGIAVETTYRGGGEGFVEYSSEEVAAQQAIGGGVAQRHTRNAEHLLTRPNTRVFGACGEDDGTLDDNRHEYMPWINFAATSTTYELGPARSCPARSPARMEVALDLLAVQRGRFLPDASEARRFIQESAASGTVNLTSTFTELSSGPNPSWSTTLQQDLDFYPSVATGPYMSLHSWAARTYTMGGGDSWATGHLNTDDLVILQRIVIPVTIYGGPDVTEAPPHPIKHTLEVELTGFTKEVEGAGFYDPSDLYMQLCGFSIVEVAGQQS